MALLIMKVKKSLSLNNTPFFFVETSLPWGEGGRRGGGNLVRFRRTRALERWITDGVTSLMPGLKYGAY